MLADKISEEIFRANKLTVTLGCSLNSEFNGRKYNYFNEFSFNGVNYGKINIRPFLTLDVKAAEGEPWTPEKRLTLSQFDIPDLVIGLTKLKILISGDKLYRIDDVDGKKQFVCNNDILEENTLSFAFRLGKMILKPCITIRRNYQNVDVYEKAISITLNNDKFYAVLIKNEVIALIQLLRNIDIQSRGNTLLTNYLLGRMNNSNPQGGWKGNGSNNYKRGAAIFNKDDTKQTSTVTSTIITETDPESYFGFK